MDESAVCQYLDWDSDFFGVRIGRVLPTHLIGGVLESALEWAGSNRIDCLYFLSDSTDQETVRLAEDSGFRFVDIRVTLERGAGRGGHSAEEQFPHGLVRQWREDDLPALRAIARVSYRISRFYFDPGFPGERCDDLYATWIERSCYGFADEVLVAEVDGQAAGYITCNLRPGGVGQIGLVGVAQEASGKGLGQKLAHSALRWFAEHGAEHVIVVTQGRNVSAQRLYERCGFVTRSLELWFHKWFA